MQKQAYISIENDRLVPIENNMYVIYHDPTKRCLNMTPQKTNKTDATNQCVEMQINLKVLIISRCNFP